MFAEKSVCNVTFLFGTTVVTACVIADSEREAVQDAIDTISEEVGIPKRILRGADDCSIKILDPLDS